MGRVFANNAPHRTRRLSLIATSCVMGALCVGCALAPAARAGFGVEEHNFEAGTCVVSSCVYTSPTSDFFTQAAGHPESGITTFEMNHRTSGFGEEPEGNLRNIRVDIPAGLAADPELVPSVRSPNSKPTHARPRRRWERTNSPSSSASSPRKRTDRRDGLQPTTATGTAPRFRHRPRSGTACALAHFGRAQLPRRPCLMERRLPRVFRNQGRAERS